MQFLKKVGLSLSNPALEKSNPKSYCDFNASPHFNIQRQNRDLLTQGDRISFLVWLISNRRMEKPKELAHDQAQAQIFLHDRCLGSP